MNIKFITNASRHQFDGDTLTEAEGRPLVERFLKYSSQNNQWVAKDYEATDLDPFYAKPLLKGLGNAKVQYIIDVTTIDISTWDIDEDVMYIGHNIKYDLKLDMVHYNIHTPKVYDTMIAEQKIYQGCQSDQWFRFDLATVTERQLDKFRTHGKDTRDDFIGANPKTFVFTKRHLEYLAEDLCDLHAIKDAQTEKMKQLDLLLWMRKVEFPLTYQLARCELNGFHFDKEGWQKNVDESSLIRHDLAKKLDKEVQRLRRLLANEYTPRLTGGKWDRQRNFQPRQITVGLFGDMDKFDFYSAKNAKGKNIKLDKKKQQAKTAVNPMNTNWGSDDVLLYLFACLKQPVPLKGKPGRKYPYLNPEPMKKKAKAWKHYGNHPADASTVTFETGDGNGYSLGKDYLTKYLVDMPNTPMRKFIMLLKQWREVNHEITGFGENFFSKINRVTGRIHTEFRQARAVNARFQSGGGDKQPEKYNAQNIPRKKKFRHCFKCAPEESIVTADLKGAELRIACDKSEDPNLYKWGVLEGDAHSPMTQSVWRHIFLYRAGKLGKAWFSPIGYQNLHTKPEVLATIKNHKDPVVRDLYELSQSFIVTKNINGEYRQAGKNGTFGGLYGMKVAKAAETFNNTDSELMKTNPNYEPVGVSKEEGEIILFAQKAAIPKAYEYVESNVLKAFTQGYIVYDERSKSRIWFKPVVDLLERIDEEYGEMYGMEPTVLYLGDGKYRVAESGEEYRLHYGDTKTIDGQARNIPISGTQTDCVKEAIVDIMTYVDKLFPPKEYGIMPPIKWLSQVHDELIFSMPKCMDGKSDEWSMDPLTVTFKYDEPVQEEMIDYEHKSLTLNKDGNVVDAEVSFPVFVRLNMAQSSSRHLSHVKMDASFDVMDSWTK